MGPLGMGEILFLLVLGLVLFGPRKLPELGRMVGKGLAEFRRASNDLRSTIEGEISTYENTVNTAATSKPAPPASATPPPVPPEKAPPEA
jgi:TatA/E family protein of Tat protein translocase